MSKKLLTIVLSIVLALFLLSISIACPLLIRGIYYSQAEQLDLSGQTGYSDETIKEAFDSVMDYCTKGGESAGMVFSTGDLAWSESGKSHFDDVEGLFRLDFVIAGITGGLLLVYLISRLILCFTKKHKTLLRPYRFFHKGPLFWGALGIFVVIAAAVLAAFIDYEAFFNGFHHLFFPGRDNWLFYASEDPIILLLPEEILQHYALVIAGFLVCSCLICMLLDIFLLKRFPKKKNKDCLT